VPGEWSRYNGFQRPFDTFQVLSWVVFGYFQVAFFVFVAPSFAFSVRLVLILAHSCLSVLVILFCVLATKTDVIDPCCLSESASERAQYDADYSCCRFCQKQTFGLDMFLFSTRVGTIVPSIADCATNVSAISTIIASGLTAVWERETTGISSF